MTPSELAKAVKETLMDKPNKKVVFTSFCNGLGDDLPEFIVHCSKHVETANKKKIAKLTAELEKLGVTVLIEPKK